MKVRFRQINGGYTRLTNNSMVFPFKQAIMGDEYDVMAKTLGAPAIWMAVTLNVVLGMLPYITTQVTFIIAMRTFRGAH